VKTLGFWHSPVKISQKSRCFLAAASILKTKVFKIRGVIAIGDCNGDFNPMTS
jgi:hypothetical protein